MLNKIMSFIKKWEGGYVNHPADPGGATNFGVTQRTFDAFNTKYKRPLKSVKDMTYPEAVEVYEKEYWKPEWEKLGFPLAACMMDTAVNMGHRRADAFLKGCDGSYVTFIQLRIAKYKELIERNPKLKAFERGWMNRVADLRRFIEVSNGNS